ncbi:hypothetical protein LSH36_391g02028, partial [Paralvinella palmiformis]
MELSDRETGVVLARCERQVVYIGTENRKAHPLPKYLEKFKDQYPRYEFVVEVRYKPTDLSKVYVAMIKIAASDMDFNYHTNQSMYYRFSLDAAYEAWKSGFLRNFIADPSLGDHLICGLRNENNQRRLPTTPKLTFQIAKDTPLVVALAIKSEVSIRSMEPSKQVYKFCFGFNKESPDKTAEAIIDQAERKKEPAKKKQRYTYKYQDKWTVDYPRGYETVLCTSGKEDGGQVRLFGPRQERRHPFLC